jgi:hypothetical protein
MLRKPSPEDSIGCMRGCLVNVSALTYMLNRVVFGLTFDSKIQGASWPAQKVYINLLPQTWRL